MLSDSEMRQLSSPVSLTIRVGRIVLVLSAIGAMIGILSAIFMKDAYSSVIFALIFYAMSFSMFTASFVGLTRKKKWGVSFGIVSFTMAAAYSAYQICITALIFGLVGLQNRALSSFLILMLNACFAVLFYLKRNETL